MKRNTLKIFIIASMICLLCFPTLVMADTRQGTTGDELQLMEAQKLEIQLGTEWAGAEFGLKTDSGIYPGAIVVDQDGVLKTEIGGSTKYTLTLNTSAKQPKSTQGPATTDDQTDTETRPGTEDLKKKDESGIPISHILLFAGGMTIAVGTLIAIKILKNRCESGLKYEDEDEEDE